jgi:D-tagatose-1,6-bisphosphate aldolase subunit GatZ/KbaZ
MSKITVSEMMKAIFKLEKEEGLKCTLLGIGPMSKPVIEASFLLAKEKDFPLMFIASRNQVDSKELGGGYVCNWDQYDFVAAIGDIAAKVGFDGIYHICRDHGGPWQRDKERSSKLPEEEAMDIGKQSYLNDLLAGFDLLHIDPTKDPNIEGVIPMEIVVERTVELIKFVEEERMKNKLPPIAYEIGTEETNGGLTSENAYVEFIKEIARRLGLENLPMPMFIVGQTGTLTRMRENVGHFDSITAKKLSKEAREYGVGLKEHNGDYLSDFILYTHPVLGITATNVAPEFGVVETGAYLMLGSVEEDAYKKGLLKEKSNFISVIEEEAIKCERWRKWMVGEAANMTTDDAMKDDVNRKLITEICGHYTFEASGVKTEREIMFNNLRSLGFRPYNIVVDRIMNSIRRYVECFNLTGLTGRVVRVLNKGKISEAS